MSEYEEILGIKIPKNTKIKAVTNSSKKVTKDSIFFGFKGTKVHGSKYAKDAIKNGASLVIHDDPLFVKNNEKIIYSKDLKKNIIKLREYGYSIIGPEIGDMACGEYGEGKMTEPSDILLHIENYLSSLQKNKKYKALVTAGPTREYLDPVRYLTNKSSGRQGYEIAKSFRDNGFETTLISGTTNLKPLEDIKFIEVETADEMLKKTIENLPVDVAVFSAAVCDYKFKKYR